MSAELLKITDFIIKSIIHVWPYLLFSIPLAVAVKLSGASKYIGKAFNKNPLVSILLATIIGAFSPFCSCSVIPIIASLLIGGVPLAPVMSFWLASPSMDPEIFFMSVSIIGWQLAVWRLAAAFGMSFFSGLITQYLVSKGWINENATLKAQSYSPQKTFSLFNYVIKFFTNLVAKRTFSTANQSVILSDNCLCSSATVLSYRTASDDTENINICGCSETVLPKLKNEQNNCCSQKKQEASKQESEYCKKEKYSAEKSLLKNILNEGYSAAFMVIKFMVLAYFLEALIVLYVPEQFITALLGHNKFASIIIAALVGIPVYTSSMPALALVAGLIGKGMAPAAGLAFLISGPTTTIPAMAAVWNLADRKVFSLYVGFTLFFAILSGLVFWGVEILL